MRNKSFILLATCYIGFLQSFGITLNDTKCFVDAITIYLNQYEDSLNINHIECDTPDYYEFFGEVFEDRFSSLSSSIKSNSSNMLMLLCDSTYTKETKNTIFLTEKSRLIIWILYMLPTDEYVDICHNAIILFKKNMISYPVFFFLLFPMDEHLCSSLSCDGKYLELSKSIYNDDDILNHIEKEYDVSAANIINKRINRFLFLKKLEGIMNEDRTNSNKQQ